MNTLSVSRWIIVWLLAAAAVTAAGGEPSAALRAAIASPDRPEADRARDLDRKPAEVLAFFGIEAGMDVLELMAGRGYYTEILGAAVGSTGSLICQNNAYVVERFVDPALTERLERMDTPQVLRHDAELDELGLEADSLDAVLLILFYHDTYWMEVDRERMNRELFEALRPGGLYGIVDHHAEAGSGSRDVQSAHRVDAELVRQEVLAAGFELEAESDLLSHPEDDRTSNVFESGIRGRTDRFIYRFRKPSP